MCLNLHDKEALAYLDDRGYSISRMELYRIKNEIKESTNERLNLIASEEYLSQHIERLDMLKTIQKEMWANYHVEKNPSMLHNRACWLIDNRKLLVTERHRTLAAPRATH